MAVQCMSLLGCRVVKERGGVVVVVSGRGGGPEDGWMMHGRGFQMMSTHTFLFNSVCERAQW